MLNGSGAAMGAAKEGASVLLVERYGFLGGETHQFYPELIYDNHEVEAEGGPTVAESLSWERRVIIDFPPEELEAVAESGIPGACRLEFELRRDPDCPDCGRLYAEEH